MTVGKITINGKQFDDEGKWTEAGYCPFCNEGTQPTGDTAIDDDDEITYECQNCEVTYKEVRQTVWYKEATQWPEYILIGHGKPRIVKHRKH